MHKSAYINAQRFYSKYCQENKDSWKSLESWRLFNNYIIKLVESYIDTSDNLWHDSVGIYIKGE